MTVIEQSAKNVSGNAAVENKEFCGQCSENEKCLRVTEVKENKQKHQCVAVTEELAPGLH